MSHTCHLPGCSRAVPPALLFCGPHWAKVPAALKQEVWNTYRPGQETDKNPSAAYCRAAYAACIAVLDALRLEDPKLRHEAAGYLRLAETLEAHETRQFL